MLFSKFDCSLDFCSMIGESMPKGNRRWYAARFSRTIAVITLLINLMNHAYSFSCWIAACCDHLISCGRLGFLEASDSRIAPVWLYWLTLYRGLALFVAILLECVETSLTASVFSIDGGRGFTRRVTFLLDPRHFNQWYLGWGRVYHEPLYVVCAAIGMADFRTATDSCLLAFTARGGRGALLVGMEWHLAICRESVVVFSGLMLFGAAL